jgi:hypothetical protein
MALAAILQFVVVVGALVAAVASTAVVGVVALEAEEPAVALEWNLAAVASCGVGPV